MCGIAGIIHKEAGQISLQTLQAMGNALRHRGPDDSGTWIDPTGKVGFAHQRLSIIDISGAGAQPFHYMGRYSIVFNGEIYNYRELKQTLLKKGYTFHSETDTEVIPAALDHYGRDFLDQLNGMFAFVLLDHVEQVLWLARDRFGEKPLYLLREERALYFGSEPAAIAAAKPLEPDMEMWSYFLGTGLPKSSGQSNRTFYRNLVQVPPATWISIKLNDFTETSGVYWTPPQADEQLQLTDDEAVETFAALLSQSVKQALISDVPSGNSLSGGTDSSSICAVQNDLKATTDRKVFSAVFPGFAKDESKAILEVSERFGLNTCLVYPGKDGAEDIYNYLQQLQEPVAHSSCYAQYKVFEAAQQHGIKVLLDGQGADEMLGGYNRYRTWYLQELWKQGKKQFRTECSEMGYSWGFKDQLTAMFPHTATWFLRKKTQRLVTHNRYLHPEFVRSFFQPSLIRKPVITSLRQAMDYDARSFGLEELLYYADRNAMAHGVEVRLPFLNRPLVDWLYKITSNLKIRHGYGKWLLRKAMDKKLPANVCWNRIKTGFETPHNEWMNTVFMKERTAEAIAHLKKERILSPGTPGNTNDTIFNWRVIQMAMHL
ncbi:asparagine synthase (glutamine-hydrolyzing) [Parasegetibacter sp. NRK P23]|uniref:asparagine synthase (glutamine-hydrolyzing) n=1 Tax=Parasegetibacter sp. NRK P23 TaxID=2942999 RepID=UPI002044C21A|nr:asparagine synthase (glutamine-hydrolyzing) [Parasegetibacter sp. NRK P23]MCM5527955.1 asparagine synthase (glutamine-hydrolyzing) [Parasegetibacter sp. NRK P23]